MNGTGLQINFSFTSFYFIPIALLLLIFTFYVYKITVPPIGKILRILLIVLRSIALFLILTALFEPKLSLSHKINLSPKVTIFVDNSQSVKKHSTEIFSSLNKEIETLKNTGAKFNIFSFGEKISRIPEDSLNKLKFNERLTSFDLIFDTLNNSPNLDAAIIFSDGNITTGSSPVSEAERIGAKLFTIGVGDTTTKADIEVSKVLSNSLVYLNKKTEIKVTLENKGFGNTQVPVTLYDGGKPLLRKTVTLSSGGINNVSFTFTPKSLGERRMRVAIPNIKRDSKRGNNSKYFYVKVLDSKIKIALICGSPSADYSFIKKTLDENKEFKTSSIVELTKDKTINGGRAKSILDSSNVLFLIGFPSNNSHQNLIGLVREEIQKKGKPYFLLFSVGTDFSKLKEFNSILNFRTKEFARINLEANLIAKSFDDPLLKLTVGNEVKYWNNLPPVNFYGEDIVPKAGTEVIAHAVLNNRRTVFPFIIKYSKARRRSITIPAGNIWRWKLRPSYNASLLFDDFINNSVKWLNAANNLRRFNLQPLKKIFVKGEKVYFQAEVYDESLNPVNTADVEVKVKTGNENFQTVLVNKNNGLYEGYFENLKSGEYSFVGEISQDGKTIFKNSGKFTVVNINPELLKTDINKDFLKLLANVSGGKYFDSKQLEKLNTQLISQLSKIHKTKNVSMDYRLWSYPLTLIIIIFLFSLEWFLRKRAGLL